MGLFTQLVVILFGGIIGFALRTLEDAGEFTNVSETVTDHCSHFTGYVGIEDVAPVRDHFAIMTSDERHSWMLFSLDMNVRQTDLIQRATTRGKLLWIDMNHLTDFDTPANVPLDSVPSFNEIEIKSWPKGYEFHPHGLDVVSEGSKYFAYIINHRSDGDFVEILQLKFEDPRVARRNTKGEPAAYDPDNLPAPIALYIKSVRIEHGNDVTVLSHGNFLVTHWHRYEKNSLKGIYEMYTQQAWGSLDICRVDDSNAHCMTLLDGLQMPNSAVYHRQQEKLYLVSTIAKHVSIYDMQYNPYTGDISDLVLNATVPTPGGCDNILFDATSDYVYTACHPKMLTFVSHSKNPTSPSPYSAVRVSTSENHELEMITQKLGSTSFSGASVAVPHHGAVIFGSVFTDGVHVCKPSANDVSQQQPADEPRQEL